MPTSATSRRGSRPSAAGFTLLELVVVLALLGLAMALVAPQGFRMIESWRRATEVDAALGVLAALGAQGRQEGRARHFPAGPLPDGALAGLPDGWTIELHEPLSVQANGACSAASGALRSGDYVRQFELQAPYCRVVLDPEGAPQ